MRGRHPVKGHHSSETSGPPSLWPQKNQTWGLPRRVHGRLIGKCARSVFDIPARYPSICFL